MIFIITLTDDYNSVLGAGSIPYDKLGFTSLEAFLKSAPSVVQCTSAMGHMMVQAVPQKGSSHIYQLVQGQKKSKKSKPSGPYRGGRGGYQGAYRGGFSNQSSHRLVIRTTSQPIYRPPLRSVVYIPPHSSIRPQKFPTVISPRPIPVQAKYVRI